MNASRAPHGEHAEITRRAFLAWMGVGATALTAAGSFERLWGPVAAGAATTDDLHFMLPGSSLPTGTSLLVGVEPVPLGPAGASAQQRLNAIYPWMPLSGRSRITQTAQGVALPVNGPLQCSIVTPVGADGSRTVVASSIVVPPDAQAAVWALIQAHGQDGVVSDVDARMKGLGLLGRSLDQSSWNALNTVSGDIDTAAALIFKHPLITNHDSQGAAVTLGLIYALNSLPALANQIATLRTTKGGYRTDVPAPNVTGDPQVFPPAGWIPPTAGATAVPLSQPVLMAVLDPSIIPLIAACVTEAVTRLRNSGALLAALGRTEDDLVEPARRAGVAVRPEGTGVHETTYQSTLSGQCVDHPEHGVRVTLDYGAGGLADTKVAVTNDYFRFLGLYVQYFDTDGNQLYRAPRTPIDTSFAECLTVAMPVTIRSGVPRPGSSVRHLSFDLPDGAVSARLLTVSLGNACYDSPDWSSYFLDKQGNRAYGGKLSPPEATMAIVLTTVINLGFPAILLLTDSLTFDAYNRAANSVSQQVGMEEKAAAAALSRMVKVVRVLVSQVVAHATPGSLIARFMNLLVGNLATSDEQAAEQQGQGTHLDSAWGFLNAVGAMFADLLTLDFLTMVVQLMVEAAGSKAAEFIPGLGEALAVAAAVVDAATLAQGSYAVVSSPWLLATEVHYEYQLDVLIHHDVKAGELPQQAKTFRVVVQVAPNNGTTTGSGMAAGRIITVEGNVADHVVNNNLVLGVQGVPAGGRVSVQVTMWSGTTAGQGWQAAAGTSPWYDNSSLTDPPRPEFAITQNLVPIDARSKLQLFNVTQYDSTDRHPYDRWVLEQTPKPNDWTQATLSAKGWPFAAQLGNITFSAPSNAVGLTFRARRGNSNDPQSEVWLARGFALNPPLSPDIDTVPSVRWAGSYTRQPFIVYDTLETDPKNGQHFILEPAPAPQTGYQVRKVPLVGSLLDSQNGDPFAIDHTSSWGCFLVDLDDVAIYHQGFIVGVNTQYGTLAVLRLPAGPSPDTSAQKAAGYAGLSIQSDSPPGLLANPTQVVVTLDGTILVLESALDRLQAFDLGGNPVGHFPRSGGGTSPFSQLATSQRQYLGLGIDGGGAIYVLSTPEVTKNKVITATDYVVHVYDPQGRLVYSQPKINVGDLAVDYFRNVRGLDFAPLTDWLAGQPAVTHPDSIGVVEPSVSSWYTTAPS